MNVKLTDEEFRDVLVASEDWFSGRAHVDVVRDAVERILTARVAEAWEEGRSAMYDDAQQWCGRAGLTCLTGAMYNPYREEGK